MIKYGTETYQVYVRQWKFPGGEVGVNINPIRRTPQWGPDAVMDYTVMAQLQNSDDVMALLMTVDAMRRCYSIGRLTLKMAYVPYGRQDRVCNDGEALSISVFAQLINSCGFDEVVIIDPHSEAQGAAIRNSRVINVEDLIKMTPHRNFADHYIVAPDAGAYKKAHKVAKAVGALGVITANKVRNLSDGKITSVTLDADVTDKKLLVVDDICDGGGTFVMLREALDCKPESVKLWITHGIFSKGPEIVTDIYDEVFTTNSFRSDLAGLGISNLKIREVV